LFSILVLGIIQPPVRLVLVVLSSG